MEINNIDWTNPNDKISKYFTVHEALYLPSWHIYHIPTEQEKQNIINFAQKMDIIRDFIGTPIKILCWIRPVSVNCPESIYNGKNYNLAIGSTANHSGHIIGSACDWITNRICSDIRSILAPNLEKWNIRMEKNINRNWIHNDDLPVLKGGNRYFNI